MKYSKIYALLLAAMVTAGSVSTATAQSGPTVHGNVYGGGNAADVNVNTTVNITGGQIGGSTVNAEHGNVFGGGKGQNTTVKGDVSVNIGKAPEGSVTTYTGTGIVKGSVYGGSALGYVNANTTKGTDGTVTAHTANTDKTTQVNVFKGTVKENVYGGGRGDADNSIAAMSASAVTVTIGANATEATPTIDGSVYGGSDANGILESDVTLHILNGTIGKAGEGTSFTGGNVYGGGLGLPTLVQGSVTVNIGAAGTTPTGTANILGDVYGGSAKGKVNATKGGTAENPTYSNPNSKTTKVNLYSNTGVRNVYGGGHGLDGASADVYGDVEVYIGATDGASTPTYTGNATINGSVFGCNNASGTPKGDVTVNVYKTAQTAKEVAAYTSSDATYAIDQVFGGGNEASYTPLETTNKAQVHIFTCLNTVKTVYGGGNAANATDVEVTIDGGRFERVFGGGNGEDSNKPAANISGSANTQVHGGRYDQVFGGSNSRGDVNSASLTLDNTSSCGDLVINNSFGGANEAEISGDIETTLICSSDPNSTFSIGSFYGGSNKADIDGSVTLNVYGGAYINVFGGSKGDLASLGTEHITKAANISGDVTLNLYGGTITNAFGGSDVNGNITGKITVNVLDYQSNTCPLSITNIYGAGNLTTYTPDKVSDEVISSPEVNVIHMKEGSSITGNVYGGGKGDADHNALVTANPIVNIGYDAGNTSMSSLVTSAYLTAIGLTVDDFMATVSGNVYGGGDLAGVTGNTTVYLRKANTSVGGSLFGGGNEAVVSGNTSVNVVNGTVTQDVYGGGALANVGTGASNTTQVTITDGTITGDVYGGGLGQLSKAAVLYTAEDAEVIAGTKQVGDVKEGAKEAIAALVYGAVTVNVNGGSVDEVFGCNNLNGAPQSTVEVNITNGNITNVFGGGNQAAYTGTPDVNISGGTINKVFGGGNEAGTGGSDVAITAGTISGGVYGGCNTSGTITGNTTVTLTGGTIGAADAPAEVCGGGLGKDTKVTNSTSYVYVGTATDVADANTYTGSTILYGDIYGGSAYGEVDNTEVNLFKLDGTSFGYNVFGGGKGKFGSAGSEENIVAKVNGTAMVNMYALTIAGDDDKAAVYGGCNVNGTATAAIVNLIGGTIGSSGTEANKVFGGGKGHETTTTSATVNVGSSTSVGSSTIYSNVYGGSALGAVGAAIVNLNKATTLAGHVFGGGMGSGTTTATAATITTSATVNQNNITLTSDIYGGCNVNGSAAATMVNLTGGSTANVFGGGLGQNTSVTGNVIVNVGTYDATNGLQGNPTITADVYGGSAQGTVNTDEEATTKTTQTAVHLYAGTIGGNVYGGGLGQQARAADTEHNIPALDLIEAHVYGNVLVDLNNNNGTCKIGGSIFGCNNQAGSPKGHVTVHVYKTVARTGQTTEQYDVAAVYGGGNEADYNPTDAKLSTEVIIEGCDKTSIQNVYGGGNAAAVPASEVLILGTKKIENVFGGGNGELGEDHAAHVGFHRTMSGTTINKTNYTNGTGKTYVKLVGGTITNVYGGSNSNGDIRGGADISMPNASSYSTQDCCSTLNTTNIYGGGKNADMSGGTSIVLGCMPNQWIDEIYAGAQNADVAGNVNLTITSGKFYRVFGGNKDGGMLKGSITVNIEETGECDVPIVIGELYGGGNLAGYSVYGYYQDAEDGNKWKPRTKAQYDTWFDGLSAEDKLKPENKKYNEPQLNIRSFTSIGTVYGGGYQALMIADPHVDINVVKGSKSATARNEETIADVPIKKKNASGVIEDATITLHLPAHEANKIGAIEHVFGGGNLATVDGSATVNIGTETEIDFTSAVTHLTKNSHNKYDVEGAIITGNVYGGGNQADITGNTQVNICAKYDTTNDVYNAVAEGTAKVTISGDVFGAGKGVTTDVDAAMVSGNSTIIMMGGSVKKSVYGGGELSQLAGNTNITVSAGTIGTPAADLPSGVTAGAIYGNVYGGGFGTADATITNYKLFGLVKGNTNVAISGGDILHNVYGGGAYGSVGDFTYDETATGKGMPTGRTANTTGGATYVTITGGTIGTTGEENGMVFGSSRGDVEKLGTDGIDPNDRLAWVYDTHVTIGTQNATTGPQIYGSLYGSGENGHTWNNTNVTLHSGTIGVTTASNETNITEGSKTYEGAAYPNRGNVYGGGCGTDMYDTDNDNEGDTYNPLAGIVKGNTTITIDGGTVAHNVYGAGAMGSVGTADVVNSGKTTINISGGTIGVSGTVGDGNVYGAARGDADATGDNLALVRETEVNIQPNATSANSPVVKGSVYGGGEVGNVKENTAIDMSGGTVNGSVFGGGKGVANDFTCSKAMVGIVDQGVTESGSGTNVTYTLLDGGTTVNISGGNVKHNVYGGGEIGRVERNTIVTIGSATGNSAPIVEGSVFGAGAGLETHGYSALVRGNSTVTVQGAAQVWHNVYGGGEKASLGRFFVATTKALADEHHVEIGMPYGLKAGGTGTVIVQGSAVIGKDGIEGSGNVFGAGQGVTPIYNNTSGNANRSKRMSMMDAQTFTTANQDNWEYTDNSHQYVWEYFDNETAFLGYIQTLAISANTDVTIGGSANVKGSVYGGSESGFVQYNTDVKIQGGQIGNNVFGGGKGLASYVDAGRVSGKTEVAISNGSIGNNVYGGGELGYVGKLTISADYRTFTWKDSDGNANGTTPAKNTGVCNVTISNSAATVNGHVFGAGKGLEDSFWCEKGIVYGTKVNITAGTIMKNVYGGGEVGRVETDAVVKIGPDTGSGAPDIKGDVFGAGAGKKTHGYSALVRGNTYVTVQSNAKVGKSVYGGGEIAAVGKYSLVDQAYLDSHPETELEIGMPYSLVNENLGICNVIVKGNAKIGNDGSGHVYGAGKGLVPEDYSYEDKENMPKRMMSYNSELFKNDKKGITWDYSDDNHQYVWEYFDTKAKYLTFVQTLALATQTVVDVAGESNVKGSVYGGSESGFVQHNTSVTVQGNSTIDDNIYGGGLGLATFAEAGRVSGGATVAINGTANVKGSVYGGGAYGIVKCAVDVNMNGGTVEHDVYGGGALADTNTGNVTGYGTATAALTSTSTYTTTVNLQGGTINGDAYGGGLGQLAATNVTAIEAKVYGDVSVTLGNAERTTATAFNVDKYNEGTHVGVVKSGRVFGCNNLNGSPQGNVTVTVNKTVKGNTDKTASGDLKSEEATKHSYHVAAVYGGGNLAGKTVGGSTNVIINGCDVSIRSVYGGGNAAEVPATDVLVNGAYEIGEVFGGGNGKDDYTLDGGATWKTNPGANVNGNTNTLLQGGLIHEAYGGSNEKGTITGSVAINTGADQPEDCSGCPLDVEKIVGAGKNADVNGDLIMVLGCKPETKTPLVFGGADNANVNGNVELTITSGTFGQVFGGNNLGGVIRGHIILNIEETGCNPIKIDELYLGGNNAAYSRYGYYNNGTEENPDLKPRTAEMHEITNTTDPNYKAPVGNPTVDAKHPFPYAQPVLNVVSCTSIGKVFGGGLGEGAIMHADPTVNINMIPGAFADGVPAVMTAKGLDTKENPNKLGIIGDVFGGGNEANVEGNTTVNIGTAAKVQLHNSVDANGVYTMSEDKYVLGAYITGNVFGGGKGRDDSFTCEKAMVNGSEGTCINIYNGTVRGSVYGGGEIGRVENNTKVTIGRENGENEENKSTPVIMGWVFGAGKGLNTHGYSALVRGNASVTIQAEAKIGQSVYGGGEIASVGKYNIAQTEADAKQYGVEIGMPYSLVSDNRGICNVIVRGNAEIGPDDMKMITTSGRPDDSGYVFGGGKGVLPYENTGTEGPERMGPDGKWESYADEAKEADYLKFIETLALATQTEVTIGGKAFVKGSVYGGSENGHVQHNCHVTIKDECQIGNGFDTKTQKGVNRRYTEEEWASVSLPECAYWEYDATDDAPYDPYAKYSKTVDGKVQYYYDEACIQYAQGGAPVGKNGQTFFGNVFGGGSGYYPYAPGKWHREAGSVGGNTQVDITGGHILSNVYGGNELTDVKDIKDASGEKGICTINMSGGTIGVPRELAEVTAHPMSCSIYGGGKGDQRSIFDDLTNVSNTNVNISGGIIYGSVYGGAEDGHVTGGTNVTISGGTIGLKAFGGVSTGNVYAGGKGNLRNVKSGIIMGDTKVTVSNGTIYHNIYGGGAYGSVGTCEYNTDGTIKKYTSGGKATINITGGEIGWNGRENGMVFGSSRGDVGAPGEIHDRLAWVNNAIVTIGTSGSETGPKINGSVYGSGENGHTFNDALVKVHSGTIGIAEGVEVQYGGVTYSGSESPYRGNVYGGGCGTDTYKDGEVDKYNPLAGIVYGNTRVDIEGGHVVRNVYGAGAMGSVGTITSSVKNESVDEGFGLSWPYKFEYAANTGKTTINITGGRIGCGGENDGNVFGAARGTANVGEYDVDKQRYEEALLANVRETEVNVKYPSTPSSIVNGAKCITGSVFGGGEDGHVNENAKITITGGLIGHSVYGGGKGKGTYRGKLKEIAGNHAEYETDICSWTAGKIYGNTEIVMTGGHVVRNIYGGGNLGSVGKGNYAGGSGDYYAHGYGEKISSALSGNTDFMQSGKAKITITGQSIVGVENINAPEAIEAGLPTGNVFGSSRGKTAADVGNLSPRYQYAPDFFLGYTNETEVIIGEGDASDYPRIYGSVYGGGRDGHVRRSTTVTINNGKIGQDYTSENYVEDIATIDVQWRERGNVFGSGSGLGTYVTKALKKGSTTEYVDIARHGTSSGSVTEKTTVNIKGGTICQNVFGGGALSSVGPPRIPPTREDDPSTEQTLCLVNIEGGTIGTEYAHGKGYGGNVYGASRGGGLYFFKEKEYDVATENLPADESSDNYATTCFTKVKMMGGTVSGDVYGGGEAGIVKHDTEVSLTGGTIMHDAYGGGRGAANIAANVGGNTLVELNKGITADKGCIVDRLFGANNVNGTPKGHVKVHVFATQNKSTKATNAKVKGQYDVSYVFGGGNASDYVPTANTESTEVIIEGCGLSSIYEVYGGGYGAAAPATNVLIKGTEIIDNVFGGGYGAGANNPGANVGYKTGGATYGVLGENVKTAVVKLMAGKINNVYGGSNTKGDIRGGASVTNVTNTGEAGCCDKLTVDQIYGGGKNAEQQGGTEIVLGCMPNDWIAEIYAGAENADVGNDVSLTITSGKFGRVFGGNKSGGKLNGSIEVNIEENPECTTPIIIGELYGGGNLAPYSIYGYKEDGTARTEADYNKMTDAEKEAEGIRSGAHQSPRVNVRAFTSIGNIFGGGYGDKAEMVGSPTVNINEVEGGREYPGETKKLEDGTEVTLYQRTKDGKMGVIGNVFGGGNAAKVTGDTNVNIGTTSSERFVSVNDDPATIDVNEQYKTVLGADIRGNVYGGGNNAEVTGNTNVTIGKKATTTP